MGDLSTDSAAVEDAKPATSPPTLGAKSRGRARTTNGNKFLEGLDGRTRQARRLRDATAALVNEYSLESESEIARALEAAGLAVWLEDQLAIQGRGEPVDMRQRSVVVKLMDRHRKAFETVRRARARSGVAA